jgi:hypothetical protein
MCTARNWDVDRSCLGWSDGLPTGSSVIHDEGNNRLDQGPSIPSPRTSPENGRIRVVGVESEPLTDEQMAAAIRALSRLIASYMAANDTPEISTQNRPSKARTA